MLSFHFIRTRSCFNFSGTTHLPPLLGLVGLVMAVGLLGCVNQPLRLKEYPFHPLAGRKKVIDAKYKDVWNTTLQVLANYPIQTLDSTGGLIITRSVAARKSPIESLFSVQKRFNIPDDHGVSYILRIQLFKIKPRGSKEKTEVLIYKTLSSKTHFLVKAKTLQSDGLEELYLLYRIKREMAVKKMIQKFRTTQEKKEEI